MLRSGSAPFAPRSNGATTCSTRASRSCSTASRSSPGALRWRLRKRYAAPIWKRSDPSWTRASSGAGGAAGSACWRRFASSRTSGSQGPGSV